MYAGQVIEIGPSKSVIHEPKHPYTSGLLRSTPNLSKLDQKITPIKGNMPNPINPPAHCRFLERCSLPIESCKSPIPSHIAYRWDKMTITKAREEWEKYKTDIRRQMNDFS